MSRQPSTDLGICLVHGAETALGAALLSQLSERGTKLRALGGEDRPPLPDGVEWAGSSPSDNEGWGKACGGVATVFDCAGSAAAASIREPNALEDSRSRALLAACRAAGVVRIIHVSGQGAHLDESEIAAEAAIRAAASDALATCAVRSGQLWGVGDEDLLGQLVELSARGWYVARPRAGEARCALTFVDRLVSALILAAERLARGDEMSGPVWAVTDGPPVDPLDRFDPVLRDLGFEPPRRRVFASWLIAWAWIWSALHRVYLSTAPPVRAAFWRDLTRSRLEDPNTVVAAQRDLGLAARSDPSIDRQAATRHAEDALERWGESRRARIASSWSLPFFIRLPNMRRTLAVITRLHRWIYLATAGRIGHRVGATTFLMVRNVGRKSGREFLTPLLYVADGNRFVIAASNAGDARTPAWWLNLEASPETFVHAGNRRLRVRARLASPDEAKRLWPRMMASYRWFEDYHAKAGRQIPLVLLEPIRRDLDA